MQIIDEIVGKNILDKLCRIEDFYAPSNVTIALFGAFSQSYEQNVKETIDWLRGEGKGYFEYWKHYSE